MSYLSHRRAALIREGEKTDKKLESYLSLQAIEDGTFSFNRSGILYSTDGASTWTELQANTPTPTITAGNKIYFKGTLPRSGYNGIGTFSSTGLFNAAGNICSLRYGDNAYGITQVEDVFLYATLFKDCIKLVSAAGILLPTIMNTGAFASMFMGCTGLVEIPNLPTTLVGSCFRQMFSGCTSLLTTPKLPATTLANNCYDSMFYGCTGLTTPPTLPATTLASSCYYGMLRGCTGLTSAPILPAITLVSGCYNNMLRECSNISYIKALFTTTPTTDNCFYWVEKIKSTGTFVKNSAATWDVRGIHGVPNNWTIETASS